MKPPARKAKLEAKPIQDTELDLEEKPKTGDFFDDDSSNDPDSEVLSDHSDFSKRPTKKRKSITKASTKKKVPAAKRAKLARNVEPELSELSDMDSEEDEREEDLRMFEKKNKLQPAVKATITQKVLRLEVRSAPTTININLTELFTKQSPKANILDDTTLFNNETSEATQLTTPKSEDLTSMRLNPEYASFLELEPELRNRIYREFLVADSVVKFNPAPRSSRQPTLLQTCRQVYEEGRGILYGENAFHFRRVDKERGRYWDNEYKEVGYKDVRRFLETIGQHNIAKIRFLSLDLSDAVPVFTPKLDVSERRYVNDPVLQHVLRLIGRSGCVLDKFVVGFAGRGGVHQDDIPFIRAFTSVSCRKLIQSCAWGHSKVDARLFLKMQDFMQAPEMTNIDLKRQKVPKMAHENGGTRYCCSKGRSSSD